MSNTEFNNPIVLNGIFYFASDFHLGIPSPEESKQRELKIINWLDTIQNDATHLFLLGDIFDFWFEYKDVVPKGYFLLFAKLYELRQCGIQIYFFTGNHDMWVNNYFTKDLGITVFKKQKAFILNGLKCLIGHGDGLGPEDGGYKLIKAIFAFRPNQKLYGLLHPRCAFAMARFFSHKSRSVNQLKNEIYSGPENEMIVRYISKVVEKEDVDIFIYGHRHLPLSIPIKENVMYYNSGDWLKHDSYIRLESNTIKLLYFDL